VQGPPALSRWSGSSAKPGAMSLKLLTVLGSNKTGGAEAFYITLNRALHARGVNVRAVLRGNPVHLSELEEAGIPTGIAGFGGLFDFTTKSRLRAIAGDFAPDAVLTFAGRASEHMPRRGYPILGRLGGYYNLKHFKNCDHLICNTPDLIRHVTDTGWPTERVTFIPNFPRIDESPAVNRGDLDTPPDAPLALVLARLHPNKAVDALIETLPSVPELWLWIAGEGDQRAKIEQRVLELGLSNRVKFLGWRTDRAALFGAADLCLVPSRQEPFGNVIVEAWAYGVPVIAAAATGPKWLIKDGEDGILVPIDNPRALAGAIRDVLADPARAERLAQAGKLRAAAEFSEDAIVTTYLELIERVRADWKTRCAG
jgi:glycosyltransferase involved in cell wall biosynthesis